jgi:hypothetical protein
MTAVFLLADKLGALDELPPGKAVRSLAPNVSRRHLPVLAGIAHALVGGAGGAAYGLLRRHEPGAMSGLLHGVLVWTIGYEIVMPAATDIPLAHRDRRPRALTIFIAHLVYGLSLGMFARMFRPAARESAAR